MILPIHEFREEILRPLENKQCLIVVGETGSGKTTQIPQFLYKADFGERGIIGITEPRRLAAISTAAFVAREMGAVLGDIVGYQIRFNEALSDKTRVKFMTDGILLRECQLDPNLKKYSVIMVDEAHERSLNIDFVMGLLKDLLKRRKDLRLVISSATIDERRFSQYFWDAPVVNVSGRVFPVDVVWSGEHDKEETAEAAIQKIKEIHAMEGDKDGGILCFMPGEEDIRAVINGIEELNIPSVVCLPVYGALSPDEQQKIFSCYPGRRKVVVATNIAETSITIEDIRYVVDSGLVKQTNFHQENGIQRLEVVPHSQAGCKQRAGRAGRTQAGICYRLYSEANFKERPLFTKPEITRSCLAGVVLAMESIGIQDVENFDFLDAPEQQAFHEAYETLIALGAINANRSGLTELGKTMAKLPLEPRIARMLIEANRHNCAQEVATIASFLSLRNIFIRPQNEKQQKEADRAHAVFKNPASDALAFLKIWQEYEASDFSNQWCRENFLNAKALREASEIRRQLFAILEQNKMRLSANSDQDAIAKAVATGLVYNLMEHESRFSFKGVMRPALEHVFIHPASGLFSCVPRWMVTAAFIETKKSYAVGCHAVKPQWLPDIVPHLAKFGDEVLKAYDPVKDVAIVEKFIFYNERRLNESVESQVNRPEAEKIQHAAVQRAIKCGWQKIVFVASQEDGVFAGKDESGQIYRTWSFAKAPEEGVPYYCEVETFCDARYATPKFRIFDLGPVEPLVIKDALGSLAEKWGARLEKR